jgi:glycosyltransferase involved in cell wall biosynthesis
MAKIYDLIVVIPVGPNETLEDVFDTVESVLYYTTRERRIILVDDSGKDTCIAVQAQIPDIDVVKTPHNNGGDGGLYLTLSLGYLHAHRNYTFKVLLKLDVDALVIGERPEKDAISFFARYPHLGLIGHYRFDTRPDPDDLHWSKTQLLQEARRKSLLRDPILCLSLRRLLRSARSNGFQPGDYVFGGSYFMSDNCVRRLAVADLLSKKELGRSLLQEDHILGLLAKAAGIEMGDFVSGDLPMALEWKGLPCSPHELVARRKKITHSTRGWKDIGENEIREFFRDLRSP